MRIKKDNKPDVDMSGGIGFTGMLTILFIGLKLTDNIDWSWWWVFSPLWIPIAIVIGILLLILLWMLISSILRSIGI